MKEPLINDVRTANSKKITQALMEFEKHPFCDLVISKFDGVVKSFKVQAEVRFNEGRNGK